MRRRLASVLSRLRLMARRGRLTDELGDELDTHFELLVDRYIRAGMSAADAHDAARRQLGNTTRVREDIYRMNGIGWLEAILQDVRDACRRLVRTPGFSVTAVAMLALGIGANTGVLSVAYGVLAAPLPYPHADELYSVDVVIPERRDQVPSMPPTVQAYLAWRSAPTVFSAMAALRPWECNLTGGLEPERVGGARVSANFFSTLGIPIARGRSFSRDEEQPGREGVVVISDALWRRRYGADSGIVGRTILINEAPHVVVGIASPSALVPTGTLLHALLPFGPRVDIWKPIAPTPRELGGESWDHGVIARLAPGASAEQGREQLESILRELLRTEAPEVNAEPAVRLVLMRDVYAGPVRLQVLLTLTASALLLLTACVSLANLLLARATARATELATRIALGAGRARVVGLMVADAAVLTLAGGLVGSVVAFLVVRLLVRLGPPDLALLIDPRPAAALLVAALATGLLVAIVCGVVPGWVAWCRSPAMDLQAGGRTTTESARAARTRRVLVAVEMSLATALLASAGLLLHSFQNVMQADRGYDVEHVLTADLSLFGKRYDAGLDRIAFYERLVRRIRALHGVRAAGAISDLPAIASSSGASRTIFLPEDSDFERLVLARPVAMIRAVSTGYFAASGTALEAGRLLHDREPADVAIISRSLAARLWPGARLPDVVGRQFRQGNVTGPLITIAGVAGDVQAGSLDHKPPAIVYRPYAQWASGPMTLVVRAVGAASGPAPDVRLAIRALDPDLPVVNLRTMREIVSSTVAARRFQMALTLLFAVIALTVGAVGLYGVVSHAVACRTREFGVRLAFGATRRDVRRAVLAQGLPPVLIGLAAGLAAAIAGAAVMRHLLFGITAADPLTIAASVLVLLTASVIACLVPARRAAALDPVDALRDE